MRRASRSKTVLAARSTSPKRHNGFDFSGKVGLPHLKVQMAAFRQADHAQILDQPGQAFDLGQQAAELGFIGVKTPSARPCKRPRSMVTGVRSSWAIAAFQNTCSSVTRCS